MLTDDRFTYQETGIVPLLARIFVVPICIAGVYLISYLYSGLILFIPILYANFIITLFCGLSIGGLVLFFARLFKVRNSNFNLLVAGMLGCFALYFSWYAYAVKFDDNLFSFTEYWNDMRILFSPSEIFEVMEYMYRFGVWTIFGLQMKGYLAIIVWMCEMILLIGIPILVVMKFPKAPFSEKYNKWYKNRALDKQFEGITMSAQLENNMIDNVVNAIGDLNRGKAQKYSLVYLYYLPQEEQNYLSIVNVFIPTGGSGRKEKTPILELVKIDKDSTLKLIEEYGIRKSLFRD